MVASAILDRALADLLNRLTDFIPPSVLPDADVSIVGIEEETVGLGNWRGTGTFGPFTVVALKGGRLNVVARFRLWANEITDVDLAANALHSNLIQARDTLWNEGFLKLAGETVSPADYIPQFDAWVQNVDYRVLYEFRYEDDDGAESLIARILIDSDPEVLNSPNRESMVVDHIARWDSVEAPALLLRADGNRPQQITELKALFFLPPTWTGAGVTITVATNGVMRSHTFANARLFFETVLVPQPDTVQLGGNSYRLSRLAFPNPIFPEPIVLTGTDVFQVRYAAAMFDSPAVAYLHAQK